MPELSLQVKVIAYSANLQEVTIEKDEVFQFVQKIDRPKTETLSEFLYVMQQKYNLEMYPLKSDMLGYCMLGCVDDFDYQILLDILEGKASYG